MEYVTRFELDFELPVSSNDFLNRLEALAVEIPADVTIHQSVYVLETKLENAMHTHPMYGVDGLLSGIYNGDSDSMSWYSHQTDMREFSKLFPTVLFILSGEGEESGDIWKEYYKNGKCQVENAQIVIGDFDETKLS